LFWRRFLIWCNPICKFLLLIPDLLESYWEIPCLYLYLGVFSSISFKVSHVTLRSLTHKELIFVQVERQGYSFSPLHEDVLLPQDHLLKKLSSLTYFDTFVKNQKVISGVGLFLCLLFYSIGLCVYFCARTMLSLLLWLCSISWKF
jgi:hypothetical protein